MESAMQKRIDEFIRDQQKAASRSRKAQQKSARHFEHSMEQKVEGCKKAMQEMNERAAQTQLDVILSLGKKTAGEIEALEIKILREVKEVESTVRKQITEVERAVQLEVLNMVKTMEEKIHGEQDATKLDLLAKCDCLRDDIKSLQDFERAWQTSYKDKIGIMEQRIYSMRILLFGSKAAKFPSSSFDKRDSLDLRLEQVSRHIFKCEALLPPQHSFYSWW